MESILSELGAVNENEGDVQRNILKERVLTSIRFPKVVGDELVLYEPITILGGIPELSRKSHQIMLSDLSRELRDLELLKGRSTLYEIALIKLRVFQGLVDLNGFENFDEKYAIPDANIGERAKRPSVFNTKIERNSNPAGRVEANFMTLAQVGKDPGHSISSSTRFTKSGMSGGSNLGLYDLNLHVHGKGGESQKWNIDDSMIDGLKSEAMNSRSNDNQCDHKVSSSVPSSRVMVESDVNVDGEDEWNCDLPEQNSPVSGYETRKEKKGSNLSSSLERNSTTLSGNLTEPASNEKRKHVHNKKQASSSGYSGDGKASKRVKRKVERESDAIIESRRSPREPSYFNSNEESVTCPICANDLPLGQLSAAAVLDKHIDRCGRRLQAQVTKIRSLDNNEDEDALNLLCDGEEGISHSRRPPVRATRSRKAMHVESRSGSESDFEDPKDDFDPESDGDDSDTGSIEDSSEGTATSRPKTAADSKGGKRVLPGKLKGKKMKKDIIRDLVEPSLNKKDMKKADKLLRDAKRGRGFNRKGIIEEDKAEVFDDWEDDFYLDRLAAAGIDDFESAVRLANSKIKKEKFDGAPLSNEKEDIVEASGEDEAHLPGVHRGYLNIGDTLDIDKHTWDVLFDYQKQGVQWLYNLYESGVGGILGDEMGLGKTAQLCCHFGSLARKQRKLRKKNGIFLVVCPATVLQHWLKEFHRWVPAVRCVIMHSISKTGSELQSLAESGERQSLGICKRCSFFTVSLLLPSCLTKNSTRLNLTPYTLKLECYCLYAVPQLDTGIEYVLRKLQRFEGTQGLVVLITYDGLRRHKESLSMIEWTGVCLDEGQKIRNPETDIAAVCKVLPSYHRIILSGTPIQNSLRELWSLFDFIYPGRLGALSVFELEFCEPIRAGGYRNASKLQAEIAVRCAATLQRIVRPYLLRRKKDDLTLITKLPKKTEQVLFCKLSERQKEIYRTVLASTEVQSVIEKRMMPFRAINTLRKLCNHPELVFQSGRVVWQDEKKKKPVKGKSSSGSSNDTRKDTYLDSAGYDSDDDCAPLDPSTVKWENSGKLMVLCKVLPLWYSEGHKVLLFTQTHSMLNLLELMMKQFSFRFMRLDGMTPVAKREGIIETFNKDPTVFVMILTTRTGGVGISLTAANRVVLIDPDWNPQTDVQARERAWRLGQLRDVTIYRLICRGTIEEKIYQRQIFKLLLTSRILDDPKQKALFTRSDIKELFQFDDDDEPKRTAVRGREHSDLPEAGKMKMTSAAYDSIVAVDHEIDAIRSEGTLAMSLDTETFVEQEIPQSNSTFSSSSSSSSSFSSSSNAESDPNSRDKRLLQALFDGEALSAVYDHSFIEPGMGGSDEAREARVVQEQASIAVDQAMKQLQASAPSYRGVDQRDSVTAPASSSRNPPLPPPRFGGSSSSSILAGLKASQSLSQSERKGGISTSSNLSSTHGSSSSSVPGSQGQNNITSSSSTSNFGSVTSDILRRLGELFVVAHRNSGPGTRDTGLATNVILQHFSDLGDQYAALFKDSLHQTAVLKDGRWYKR